MSLSVNFVEHSHLPARTTSIWVHRVSLPVFSLLCSTLTSIFLEPFPFTDEELDAAGLRGEVESLSPFTCLSHTYHIPCRRFRVRRTGNGDDDGAPGTLKRVPYLLS